MAKEGKEIVIEIKGIDCNDSHTISEVLIGNVRQAVSIERPMRTFHNNIVAVPDGLYELKFVDEHELNGKWKTDGKGNIIHVDNLRSGDKKKFNKDHKMIELMEVPDRSDVNIGWGNTIDDTTCDILIGTKVGEFPGKKGIQNSRVAYACLYKTIFDLMKVGPVLCKLSRGN